MRSAVCITYISQYSIRYSCNSHDGPTIPSPLRLSGAAIDSFHHGGSRRRLFGREQDQRRSMDSRQILLTRGAASLPWGHCFQISNACCGESPLHTPRPHPAYPRGTRHGAFRRHSPTGLTGGLHHRMDGFLQRAGVLQVPVRPVDLAPGDGLIAWKTFSPLVTSRVRGSANHAHC